MPSLRSIRQNDNKNEPFTEWMFRVRFAVSNQISKMRKKKKKKAHHQQQQQKEDQKIYNNNNKHEQRRRQSKFKQKKKKQFIVIVQKHSHTHMHTRIVMFWCVHHSKLTPFFLCLLRVSSRLCVRMWIQFAHNGNVYVRLNGRQAGNRSGILLVFRQKRSSPLSFELNVNIVSSSLLHNSFILCSMHSYISIGPDRIVSRQGEKIRNIIENDNNGIYTHFKQSKHFYKCSLCFHCHAINIVGRCAIRLLYYFFLLLLFCFLPSLRACMRSYSCVGICIFIFIIISSVIFLRSLHSEPAPMTKTNVEVIFLVVLLLLLLLHQTNVRRAPIFHRISFSVCFNWCTALTIVYCHFHAFFHFRCNRSFFRVCILSI